MEVEYKIKDLIRKNGAVSVAAFMEMVISDANYGYYAASYPIRANNDFVTSPEISQVFGEIIGVWCAYTWEQLGRPQDFALVELGPGRGILMKDLLRATKHVAGFHDAMSVHLVECSKPLTKLQSENLQALGYDINISWHENFGTIPDKPIILIANEFFDALPVHQYTKYGDIWYENMVTLVPGTEELRFVDSKVPEEIQNILEDDYHQVQDGGIVEICPQAAEYIKQISSKIKDYSGAALIIDYGYSSDQNGNNRSFVSTLQSVKEHKLNYVLSNVGKADITAHIDFAFLSKAAWVRGVKIHGPVSQRHFLTAMGISLRSKILFNTADENQKLQIITSLDRLVAPDKMGELFKVLAITNLEGSLAGFD